MNWRCHWTRRSQYRKSLFYNCCCSKTQNLHAADTSQRLHLSPSICLFVNNSTISYLLFPQVTIYTTSSPNIQELLYTRALSHRLHHTDMHCSLTGCRERTNQHISTRHHKRCLSLSLSVLLHSEMMKHNYWTNLTMRNLGVFPIVLSLFHYIVWALVNCMRRPFHYHSLQKKKHNGFLKHIQHWAIISGWRFTLLSLSMMKWDPALSSSLCPQFRKKNSAR